MRIRIVKTPPSQAKLWVREAWVGLEMETLGLQGAGDRDFTIGVLGGRPENLGGYRVAAEEARRVLLQSRPDAEAYWHQIGVFAPGNELVFSAEVCEEVSGGHGAEKPADAGACA